jgi:hypothetical protein
MKSYELMRLVNDSDLGHDEVNVFMNSDIYLSVMDKRNINHLKPD